MARPNSKKLALPTFLMLLATFLTLAIKELEAQSTPPSSEQAKWTIRIAGVTEPPELLGEAKKPIKLTIAQHEFGDIVGTISEKDKEKTKAARLRLSHLLSNIQPIRTHFSYVPQVISAFLKAMITLPYCGM
jgi:hypothetical protein